MQLDDDDDDDSHDLMMCHCYIQFHLQMVETVEKQTTSSIIKPLKADIAEESEAAETREVDAKSLGCNL